MPIKPENRTLYPKDWKTISQRIRFERAAGRCEFRGEDGLRCPALHGEPHPITLSRVVLTVAHLDHDPQNCADDNLKAACQRCHLAYDSAHHRRNSERTRRARKASGDLFT